MLHGTEYRNVRWKKPHRHTDIRTKTPKSIEIASTSMQSEHISSALLTVCKYIFRIIFKSSWSLCGTAICWLNVYSTIMFFYPMLCPLSCSFANNITNRNVLEFHSVSYFRHGQREGSRGRDGAGILLRLMNLHLE